MENIKIDGCDFWGNYDGFPVYRCFRKKLPAMDNIVFALGGDLYLNGAIVGYVDDGGRVSRWNPAAGRKKKETRTSSGAVPSKGTVTFEHKDINTDIVSEANDILANSWKRSVEDLVGERFSDTNDNSL